MANVYTTIVTVDRIRPRDTLTWVDKVVPFLQEHGFITESESDGSWWIGSTEPASGVLRDYPGLGLVEDDEVIDVIAKHALSGSLQEVSTCKLRDVGAAAYVFEDGIVHVATLHDAMHRLVMEMHGRL